MFRRTFFVAAVLVALLGSASIASADFRFQRRFSLQPGGVLTLGASGAAVEVIGEDAAGGRITIISSNSDFGRDYDFHIDDSPGSTNITLRRRPSGWLESWLHGWWGSERGARVEIHVPRSTTVTVRTGGGPISASRISGPVRLVTSGGGVRVADMEGLVDLWTSGGPIWASDLRGDIQARTSGGGITVSRVRGSARVDTSGGPIVMTDVSGPISARTSGGGVRISGAGARVDAHTSGGPLSVAFAAGNREGGDLSSSGGGVAATVDPSVGLSIDATSGGGPVVSEMQLLTRGSFSRQSIRGDLNGGGSLLRLRSTGGGVRISATR